MLYYSDPVTRPCFECYAHIVPGSLTRRRSHRIASLRIASQAAMAIALAPYSRL